MFVCSVERQYLSEGLHDLTHLTLPQQSGLALRLADDKAAIVKAGTVFLEPVGDLALVISWQQVAQVSVRSSHYEVCRWKSNASVE